MQEPYCKLTPDVIQLVLATCNTPAHSHTIQDRYGIDASIRPGWPYIQNKAVWDTKQKKKMFNYTTRPLIREYDFVHMHDWWWTVKLLEHRRSAALWSTCAVHFGLKYKSMGLWSEIMASKWRKLSQSSLRSAKQRTFTRHTARSTAKLEASTHTSFALMADKTGTWAFIPYLSQTPCIPFDWSGLG